MSFRAHLLLIASAVIPCATVSADDACAGGRRAAGSLGPDVIVGSLPVVQQFGRQGTIGEGVVGLSVSTLACNKGTIACEWFPFPSISHPIMTFSLYRSSVVAGAERFEQIGYAWLKHGFATVQHDDCGLGCDPSTGSAISLGVGCSDPYNAQLNAEQCGMGPRSVLNPFTGAMPAGGPIIDGDTCPFSNFPARDHRGHVHDGNGIEHRLQVREPDLDPSLHPDAEYFVEGHYVLPQEYTNATARANGNMHNNVSHREFSVVGPNIQGLFFFTGESPTVREEPAAEAWAGASRQMIEPAPDEDGRAFLYYEVSDLGGGMWHYEYALYNMNLDRAIQAFSVPLDPAVTISNIGFHAPPNHDDPGVDPDQEYSNEPWRIDVFPDAVMWSSETLEENEQANAIRYGTLYNFRFDADMPPNGVASSVTFYKTLDTAAVITLAPVEGGPQCGNGIVDEGEDCDPPNGVDCDENCQRIPLCGDEIIDPDEDCDPPNGQDCDDDCQRIPLCGDGIIDPGEGCDPPNGVDCDDACQRIPVCGDGVVDGKEACDDGNLADGDGCSAMCVIEEGYVCDGQPSTCASLINPVPVTSPVGMFILLLALAVGLSLVIGRATTKQE